MSSLRRVPSLERAEHAAPALSSNARKISRHLSLPSLSLCRPQGLPQFPSPESSLGCCSLSVPFCSPSCGHQHEAGKIHSFRSMPSWSTDAAGDLCVHAINCSTSMAESLDVESSVVYKDMRESIHFQVPRRDGCMSNVSVTQDMCRVSEVEEENAMDSPSSYLREMPMSLRMLKRKVSLKLEEASLPCFVNRQQMNRGPCPSLPGRSSHEEHLFDGANSAISAFASLIFMMKSLQQHTLWLRKVLMNEADTCLQAMKERDHLEVQESFLWLFQKVFARTPKLMLLTMILLTDFAVHSMGKHAALAMVTMDEPPTACVESSVATGLFPFHPFEAPRDESSIMGEDMVCCQEGSKLCFSEGGVGDGVAGVVKVGGGMDGDAALKASLEPAAMTIQDAPSWGLTDASAALCSGVSASSNNAEEHWTTTELWQKVVSKELMFGSLANSRHLMVAPVRAPALEADDYACYDRTDLNYQQELCRDPNNPLLLVNYAQFLHVVRHDHDRSEALYKRALKADPGDGELIGRYANFLWIGKEDAEAADEAYKSALAVDSSNAYHAGSYAHFLWNVGADQDQEDTSASYPVFHEVTTS